MDKQIPIRVHLKNIIKELASEKFAKFFIIGVTAFVIDSFVLYILQKSIFSHEESKLLGLIYTSKLFSSIVGVSVSFTLNRYWSFKATHNRVHGQAFRMAIVFGINIFISAVIYSVYYEILKYQNLIDLGDIAIPFANAATIGTMMISNFFIYKLVVFK